MNRRNLLGSIGSLGVGLVLNGCNDENRSSSARKPFPSMQNEKATEGEVTAVEDLMREHGVLRRALFVYSEAAMRLRSDSSTVMLDTLHKTARLFRAFGEDYHEKMLEETYIFPAVKKAGGEAARYPDILVAQHQRGREITDYIIAMTQKSKSGVGNIEHQQFGEDGFEKAIRQISDIENELGLADLTQFTAPPV
jgi:hemerythrin-like domain-containing protein